jgi:acyl-coenzyme A synthetase/AMP-(fatty) acid ligase
MEVAETRGEPPATVELTGDDVAFMVYVGTTGDPKGARTRTATWCCNLGYES